MNTEAVAELNRILKKEPHELNEYEKAFLRARKPYVGKKSRMKFAEIFGEQVVENREQKVMDILKEKQDETIVDVGSIDPPMTIDSIDEDENEDDDDIISQL